ncbi:MAG: 23S rRNA (pseudouridine(1915)-N(3))-methyltransferase RlmH, partial [Oscillospiraceae bacterium]|nr:23S rRNA (pseudouridine(1915)-N(3))-methyltransferase RlmH [Oscillospiraceae bacterium]
MFDITLIVMGKLKEKFYLSAAAEYEKRLKGYCSFRLVELPEHRLPEDPSPA